MIREKITKAEADRLMKNKGKTRGLVLKTLGSYVASERGREAIELIEKRMKELGYPFKFENIFSFRWYPAPLIFLVILVVLEFFNWDKKRSFEIGYKALITSLFARLMLRSFTSLDAAFKVTPRFWRSYSTLGDMEWVKHDIKKRYAVLRLSNYQRFQDKIYPILYDYMRGYLTRIMEIITKSKKVEVELTKCISNGDPYDEFTFRW